MNNANVAKYLTSRIPFPYSIDDANWWLTVGSKNGINKAIEHQGHFVGVIGVTPGLFENERTSEIGYWIGEDYWGQGFATCAVSQMTSLVFQTTNTARIFAPVFSPNIASSRVLEKCGYRSRICTEKSTF